ncbi:hypothetical protein NECAME_07443 [Necator americanus]|uniref:Uncharacterized protein n=1 Tax=Necator americanus TaxID=51031 RepID=W2TMK4_NECAM|nr:hypothetical protein NECAME_07443 [Necator americanus]ETN83325.1 hypothetical protein NECAME_07443 [Necator americanus]
MLAELFEQEKLEEKPEVIYGVLVHPDGVVKCHTAMSGLCTRIFPVRDSKMFFFVTLSGSNIA